MARKTTKQIQALLVNHENLTRYWANKVAHCDGRPVTDDYREAILTGLNIMTECALSNAGCYHGFRYIRFIQPDELYQFPTVDGWATVTNFKPVNDPANPERVMPGDLSPVEEQTRQYFSKV
jgi:hypothetical protein